MQLAGLPSPCGGKESPPSRTPALLPRFLHGPAARERRRDGAEPRARPSRGCREAPTSCCRTQRSIPGGAGRGPRGGAPSAVPRPPSAVAAASGEPPAAAAPHGAGPTPSQERHSRAGAPSCGCRRHHSTAADTRRLRPPREVTCRGGDRGRCERWSREGGVAVTCPGPGLPWYGRCAGLSRGFSGTKPCPRPNDRRAEVQLTTRAPAAAPQGSAPSARAAAYEGALFYPRGATSQLDCFIVIFFAETEKCTHVGIKALKREQIITDLKS